MTPSDVTSANKWAGEQLKAFRTNAGLSQARLADLATIDRSAYIALEKGRRRITETYAERLAPHLEVPHWTILLPVPEADDPRSPLARLAEVEEGLNRLGPAVQSLADRVAALEAQAPPKTGRGGSRGDRP